MAASPDDRKIHVTQRFLPTPNRRRRLVPALLAPVLLGLSLWGACTRHPSAAAAAQPGVPREVARVTFAVAGDVIPHQAVMQAAAAQAKIAAADSHGGWDVLLADIADVFRGADFGFVNLETPVAPASSKGSRPFQFDAPVSLLQSLKASGVTVVSFANMRLASLLLSDSRHYNNRATVRG